MPTARDFRYTVCGIAYVLFTTFFVLMYNGTHPSAVIEELKKWDSISLVSLVFSAPVIGILIAVIAYGLLFWRFGYRIVYYVPDDAELIQFIIQRHTKIAADGVLAEYPQIDMKKGWERKEHKKFMKYYQQDVRTLIKEGSAEYLERRWAVFWTHINMMAGIIAAFLTSTMYAAFNRRHYEFAVPKYYIIIGLIGLALYLVYAYRNTIKSYETGRDVEHYMLKYRYNSKSEAQEINVTMKP